MDFKGTDWISREPERTLVERHMRICLSASPGFKEMYTIAPSEPLLAEAASQGILKWGAAEALLSHISTSYLGAGDRGEVMVVLYALLARNFCVEHKPLYSLDPEDNDSKGKGKAKAQDTDDLETDGAKRVIRVIDFLEALLSESCHEQLRNHTPAEFVTPEQSTERLEDTFKNAHLWFNHFVKVRDFEVVSEDYLWHFLVRGAAIICADNHGGIDLLIPILFNNRLRKENVSAILIQVKNDLSFSTSIRFKVFQGMDPFGISRVFSRHVKSHQPIIRLVFALASEKSAISFNPDTPRTTPRPVPKPEEEDGQPIPGYISFDIWCAGASSDTFRVIKESENHIYQQLLQRTLIRKDPFVVHFGLQQITGDRALARRAVDTLTSHMLIHHQNFTFDPKFQKRDTKDQEEVAKDQEEVVKDQEEDTKGKGKAKASKRRTTAPRAKGPDGRALGFDKMLRSRKPKGGP